MNNASPKVSVIIPVYNDATWVGQAIDSVFQQTFKDFEIIVVDDGSVDDLRQVLDPLVQAKKVHYIYLEHKGLPAARNAGVQDARGQYIKFLDADDELFDEQLARQVEQLDAAPDNVISISNYEVVFANGEKVIVDVWFGKDPLARCLETNLGPPHAYMIRRQHWQQAGGFDESLLSCEDQDFWLRLAFVHGCRFEKLDYTGSRYYIRKGSLSADTGKMFDAQCRVLEKLSNNIKTQCAGLNAAVKHQMLLTGVTLMHRCFARRCKLLEMLPKTADMCSNIYREEMRGWRRLLLNLLGWERLVYLKYKKACWMKKAYAEELLEVSWRDAHSYL